jgi:hypothetical protein
MGSMAFKQAAAAWDAVAEHAGEGSWQTTAPTVEILREIAYARVYLPNAVNGV